MSTKTVDNITTLERYILAALLHSKKQELAYMLKPDDFVYAGHRTLYALMLERLEKGQRVDATILNDPRIATDASTIEFLEAVNAIDYEATMDDTLLEEKMDELANASDIRHARQKTQKLVTAIDSGRIKDVGTCIDALTNISEDLVSRHPRELDISLGASVISGLKRIERMRHEQKLSMGVPAINRFLYGGINQGELVIFAARPNVGKSIFTLLPAIAAASAGIDTLIAVNEMDKEATSVRMLANISGVDINAIEGNIPFLAGDEDALAVAIDQMSKMPLTFLEDAYNTSDIERLLKIRQKLNRPIRLAIVDMAGRMETSNTFKTDRERLNDVSKQLFRLSKYYHCTIIGTVQISRAGLMSDEPDLEHLKETGKWEEDSDKVFMMWADKNDNAKRVIALRKNRTGPKDEKFYVRLDGRHMRLLEEETI